MQLLRRIPAPKRRHAWGLLHAEQAMIAYVALTALLVLLTATLHHDTPALLALRVQVVAPTLLLCAVAHLYNCRALTLVRVLVLLALLQTLYPDTYALNCHFPNLDHLFAAADQRLFGCQPAQRFAQAFPSPAVAEAMAAGYVSYYLFFLVTLVLIFFRRPRHFERAAYIILAAFFVCYTIYLFLPVAGPQYYYPAAGIDTVGHVAGDVAPSPHAGLVPPSARALSAHANSARAESAAGQGWRCAEGGTSPACAEGGTSPVGVFPHMGTHFATHLDCLPPPGPDGGLFHRLLLAAHAAGERPTAAFPSSHVAIATLVMLIAMRLRMWRWTALLAVPFLFLVLSTVYIRAHYAVDALAGLLFAPVLFLALGGMQLTAKGR